MFNLIQLKTVNLIKNNINLAETNVIQLYRIKYFYIISLEVLFQNQNFVIYNF